MKEERKRKKETKAKESRPLYIYIYTTLRSPLRLLAPSQENNMFFPYRIIKVTSPLNLPEGGLERPPYRFSNRMPNRMPEDLLDRMSDGMN